MKNLIQIISGCGSAETIEECARVPVSLGATVIVVYGIWPRIDHPTGELTKYSDPSKWVNPTYQVDDVQAIAQRNGWHFIQMDKFAYNGEQYNTALDYIESRQMACDAIWYVDADECIDPAQTDTLLNEIAFFRNNGVRSVRFHKRVEIVEDWKGFTYDITGGNYGIVLDEATRLRRETYFDGNFFFKNPISYGITSVPLLHLHHFRENAANRITNGIWQGGGLEIDITRLDPVPETAYISALKAKYPHFHHRDTNSDSYLGTSLFKNEKA